MISMLGRAVINRFVLAAASLLGLPSPRFFIALTTLGACVAFYSRRTAVAVLLVMVTAMISYGALAVRNAEMSAPDAPRPPVVTTGAPGEVQDGSGGR